MLDQSRRRFIKGAVYSSTLAISGVAGLSTIAQAEELSSTNVANNSAILPTCEIQIYQNQMIGTKIMTLSNHTNDKITINSIASMNMQHANEHVVLKVDKLGKHANQGVVHLAPGEALSIVVSALSCDRCGNANSQNLFMPNQFKAKLNVVSDHPTFNGVMPVVVTEVT